MQQCGEQAVWAGVEQSSPQLNTQPALNTRANPARAPHAAHLYELSRVMTTGMSAPPMEAVMWAPSTPARPVVAAALGGGSREREGGVD